MNKPYDPAKDHDPSFKTHDLLALEQPTTHDEDRGKKPQRARTVAWTACPDCVNKKVPVVESHGCLQYREHDKVTFPGARMQCRASGSQLCKNPSPATPRNSRDAAIYCRHA